LTLNVLAYSNLTNVLNVKVVVY